MSFHPLMLYDERFHKSERKLADEGPPFTTDPLDARENPVAASFESRRRLNKEGSEKTTNNIIIDLSESCIDY